MTTDSRYSWTSFYMEFADKLLAFRGCHFFCVCGLEIGGDPVGVGGGELGEGLFPVGGELALDETGWGGAFAGGFALVLVALLGALVAVAGPLATVV